MSEPVASNGSAGATASSQPAAAGKGLNTGLWLAQGLLALAFGMAGTFKLVTPIADLAAKMSWIQDASPLLVRFIGASELAGALGLILPSVTRILPKLTVLAALGLIVVMVLGAGVHLMHGEANRLPVNLFLGGLAGFVAWGRWRVAAIPPRS
ncbi:MAG: DoxX family protein [Myxococcales bacterium]|nr:DoxX family protein [Myxococcales bacterium]